MAIGTRIAVAEWYVVKHDVMWLCHLSDSSSSSPGCHC